MYTQVQVVCEHGKYVVHHFGWPPILLTSAILCTPPHKCEQNQESTSDDYSVSREETLSIVRFKKTSMTFVLIENLLLHWLPTALLPANYRLQPVLSLGC